MEPPVVWYANFDFWVAAGTFALAIVTGLLALFTYQLLADAKATAKRQQRAYLTVEPHLVVQFWPGGKTPITSLRVHNGGPTPAHVMTSQLIVRYEDEVEGEVIFNFADDSKEVTFTIAPGATEQRGGTGPAVLDSHVGKQYLVGIRVTYRDVFDDAHELERAFFLTPDPHQPGQFVLWPMFKPFKYT